MDQTFKHANLMTNSKSFFLTIHFSSLSCVSADFLFVFELLELFRKVSWQSVSVWNQTICTMQINNLKAGFSQLWPCRRQGLHSPACFSECWHRTQCWLLCVSQSSGVATLTCPEPCSEQGSACRGPYCTANPGNHLRLLLYNPVNKQTKKSAGTR